MPLLAEVPDNVVVPLVVRLALVFSSSAVPEPVVPLIAKVPAPELDSAVAPVLNQTPLLEVDTPLIARAPAPLLVRVFPAPSNSAPMPEVDVPVTVKFSALTDRLLDPFRLIP